MPCFLFLIEGKLVAVVHGVNTPLIQETLYKWHATDAKRQASSSKATEALPTVVDEQLEREREAAAKEAAAHGGDKKAPEAQRTLAVILPDALSMGYEANIKAKIAEAG